MFLGTLRTSAAPNRISNGWFRRNKERMGGGELLELTRVGKLDEIELLTLLWPCHMGRHEGVHKGLEVRPPPLRKAVSNLPIPSLLPLADTAHGREPLVQPRLEALDLVVLGSQVVAGELEEGVRDLQHQDVGVVVLVADEDALAGAAHAMGGVVLLETLEAGED